MCLDWLGRSDEAVRAFETAARLDPEGYYTLAFRGWHQLQLGNDARAKELFEASLQRRANPIAASYLEILRERAVLRP
jgi:tetratricopeptide (TPR) repeat protein